MRRSQRERIDRDEISSPGEKDNNLADVQFSCDRTDRARGEAAGSSSFGWRRGEANAS